MRVVHTSDLHGGLFSGKLLPAADVYVVTGDIYPNDPFIVFENRLTHEQKVCSWEDGQRLPMSQWLPVSRCVVPEHEIEYQTAWRKGLPTNVRGKMFESPSAPVICVRGNHDFVDLSSLFFGDGPVYEIHEPEDVVELAGLRFGGMRGINYIYGEWRDELSQPDADDRCRRLPLDLDVLVTHAPPYGILDSEPDHYGMNGLRSYLDRARDLKAHLFGHIHGHGGKVEEPIWGLPFDTSSEWTVKMSNAATKFNVIDL